MNRNCKIISLYEKINNEGLLQSLKSEEVYLCKKCQDLRKLMNLVKTKSGVRFV